jgi:hypothetical protein
MDNIRKHNICIMYHRHKLIHRMKITALLFNLRRVSTKLRINPAFFEIVFIKMKLAQKYVHADSLYLQHFPVAFAALFVL